MEHAIGSLRIRDNGGIQKAGWELIGDKHLFDHMTYVVSGGFECWRWSSEPRKEDRTLLSHAIVRAPHWYNIAAGEYHDFKCIEPGILHCIFASRDPIKHEVVDQPNGWAGAAGLFQAHPRDHLLRTSVQRAKDGD